MATLSNPVIVIPGITANYLRDDYTVPPETVWSVLTKDYERASLHPDNVRYEAIEPARVQPDQLFEVVYKELIDELRHNLSPTQDQPVPVFPFAYDWRQPLKDTELQLKAFVDEVIARTRLLKHYDADAAWKAAPRVNLVGHSMGGLVIAGYLEHYKGAAQVGKVATLAAPFRGSFEAVIKIITGTANLGGSVPSSREREAARLTPAIYHLFPSFAGVLLPAPPGLPPTFFDPAIWQPSVLETLREYVRLHGLPSAQTDIERARTLFSDLLRDARDHRTRVENFTLPQANLVPADWLCVVGVDSETRVQMHVELNAGVPNFVLSSDDRANQWAPPDPVASRRTGDGTVPFEGAVPAFLSEDNLVCVVPDDFGSWEITNRAILKLSGFHGILPAMDMLHRLIVLHFTGLTDTHGNVWGRAAPGVTNWQPAVPNLLRR